MQQYNGCRISTDRIKDFQPHLLTFDFVLLFYPCENLVHIGLEHHSSHDEFVENEVHLVHVKDEIQFAHIFKTLVQRLDEHLENQRTNKRNTKVVLCHYDR